MLKWKYVVVNGLEWLRYRRDTYTQPPSHSLCVCVAASIFPLFQNQVYGFECAESWPEEMEVLNKNLGCERSLCFVLFSIHQQERGLRVDRDFLCKQLKAVIRGTWCSEISQDPWSIHCLRYLMDFEIANHFMLCFCFQNFSLRVMLSGFSWAWEAFNLNQIILKELSYHALLNTSRLGATEKKTCVFITEGKPLWQQHFCR